MNSLRAFLADVAHFLATAVAADYLAEARARDFDAHVDAALELAAPTPNADAVVWVCRVERLHELDSEEN
jgi:hypothetical protein